MALNAQRAQDSCQGTGYTHGAPPMTVLVTGAGGFIGVHAALMVRRRGHGELLSRQRSLCICYRASYSTHAEALR